MAGKKQPRDMSKHLLRLLLIKRHEQFDLGPDVELVISRREFDLLTDREYWEGAFNEKGEDVRPGTRFTNDSQTETDPSALLYSRAAQLEIRTATAQGSSGHGKRTTVRLPSWQMAPTKYAASGDVLPFDTEEVDFVWIGRYSIKRDANKIYVPHRVAVPKVHVVPQRTDG